MQSDPSLLSPVPKEIRPSRMEGGRHWAIVGGLLLLYSLMAVSASTRECTTTDETLHLTSGYLYWAQPSKHIFPENGIAAQTWAALPLLFDHLHAPEETGEPWGILGSTGEFYRFFYSSGNDPSVMLFQARIMISLLGATLGAMIFFWSRELFGARGGYLSLLLFIFCPTMLANGALVTTDMAATLGFFAATYFFWKLSHKVSWLNLLLSVFALSYLVLAKMSSGLIIFIFFLILVTRLISRRPIEFKLFTNKIVQNRCARAGIWSGLLVLHLVGVVGMLWFAYNFQYFSRDQEAARMQILSSPDFSFWSDAGMKACFFETISETELLPPAYIEGLSYILQVNEVRFATLCGKYSVGGFWWYFPFAFLVKTPVASLLLFLFSLAALALWRWLPIGWIVPTSNVQRCPTFYELVPLFILGGVYGVACVTSHADGGSRYLMPVYPVLFVLAGANVFWLLGEKPIFKIALTTLLVGTMTESLSVWPHYLAFFNQLVGGPRNGYKYFGDSSLDWGQDLPALHQWLEKNVPAAGENTRYLSNDGQLLSGNAAGNTTSTRVYLSYDGEGDPKFYGINVLRLPGAPENFLPTFPLQGGIYCISANMLEYLSLAPRWTPKIEQVYRLSRDGSIRWYSTANDSVGRNRLLQEKSADYWIACVRYYTTLRLDRLCAYLRQRAPDDEAGYSILIFRLSDEEVQRALNGDPPQSGN